MTNQDLSSGLASEPYSKMGIHLVYIGLVHNRKASSALCTLVERENKSLRVPAKTVK